MKQKPGPKTPHPHPNQPNPKPNPNKIRLNRLLAHYGLCSRRKADEWIVEGKVAIDGEICRDLGTQVNPVRQEIRVEGKILRRPPPRYYLAMNKPRSVVTTKSDPEGRKTIVDLLPELYITAGVFPVGRLDSDSEGLLILTNDGDWGQILIHPSHEVWKEYRVEVDKNLTPAKKKLLETGIELDGQKTLPAQVRKPENNDPDRNLFIISIREGRNRQIRRMCQEIGLKVKRLKRISIGPLHIGKLPSGQVRPLRRDEIQAVRSMEKIKSRKSEENENSD